VCGLGLANVYVGFTEILNRLRTGGARVAEHLPPSEQTNRQKNVSHDVQAEALVARDER
jgi:hypothetical protein